MGSTSYIPEGAAGSPASVNITQINGTAVSNSNPLPVASPVYSMLYDYTDGTVLYVGSVAVGSLASTASAIWQIEKFIYTGGNVTSAGYAAGTVAFNQVWDNRASLVYS